MVEGYIEKHLGREVRKMGGRCLKWVSPGNRGVPDRIVILPNDIIHFVELKAPYKTLDPLQVVWRDRLLALGCNVHCIDSIASVDRFIRGLEGGL